MPKFAANLSMMFNEVPFPERFKAAARAGFKAVEFLFPYDHTPEEVAGWLKENGLQNVLFNMPPGDWAGGERGIGSLPGREEEFRANVGKALRYAKALGTPRLHAMAGFLRSEADRPRQRAVFVENLRFAARELAKDGLTLLVEPINTRDMPNYFLNTQEDGHAICAEVGEPNIKVQMDFYHTQIVQGDVSMRLRTLFAGVGHVQIAGVPARHEPDTGELDNGYLMQVLDELGYDGWVGGEYRPKGRTEDGLGWLKAWG